MFAYAEGPDPGLAAVPGEASCSSCHGGGAGSGSVSVAFPKGLTYAPGVSQHLTVTIADAAQKRWGFEATARLASDSSAQAGWFAIGGDGFTQLVCSDKSFFVQRHGVACLGLTGTAPLQYIEQTLSSTRSGTKAQVTFEFDWTPPASGTGDIKFYVAANAANGDGSTGGDHIYEKSYTLSAAVAVPTPTISAVVNAASFLPGVSSGSWLTVTGTNLSNTSRSWTAAEIVNGALPSKLDGVSVTVNGKPGFVQFISPGQINVQAPGDGSTGPVAVQVTNNGVLSAVMMAQLQTYAPAFFAWNGKYPVATRPDYSYVGPAGLFPGVVTTPAKPGDYLILWGTGFGPTSPAVAAGQQVPAGTLASVVSAPGILLGSLPATVVGAALSPGAAGLYQIVIQVPANAGAGDVPVFIQQGGQQFATGLVLTIAF